VPFYLRAPAVGTEPRFIAGLERLVRDETSRAEEPAATAALAS
jgi:hypothetical protein